MTNSMKIMKNINNNNNISKKYPTSVSGTKVKLILCYGFKIADYVYCIHLRFKLFKTIEQLFAVVKNEVLHIYFSGA